MPNELPTGTTLGNHRILGVLGRGGMGVVYEAEDTVLGRPVAIKVLPDSVATDPKALERFLREARSAARLTHPNVVSIFEIGKRDASHYLVMEKVDGLSLSQVMDSGPLPWKEATEAVIQACRGLSAAHRAGLVHRDIKPANLLRDRDGTIKIADFGLAKLVEDADAHHLTQTGRVVGTPAFMSPEQCHNLPLDARSDLYSLGATYYGLLTGQGPYCDSTSIPKIMFAHCYNAPPDPRLHVSDLPEACGRIIAHAMAKAPADRYASSDAMRADLEAVLAGLAPTLASSADAKPSPTSNQVEDFSPPTQCLPSFAPSAVDHLPRKPFWTRRAALGAGIGGIAVAVASGAWLISHRRGSNPPDAPSKPAPSASMPIPPKAPPIRVGLLCSESGSMASSEVAVQDGLLLAIDELNASGGILGRTIEPIIADGRSDPARFASEAQRLIDHEHVDALFGCWTSASRKAVRTVVEQSDHLLFYPVQYEGLEESPNIIYLGAAPNQQLLPAVKWAYTDLGRRFFHVGSDYIFPRAAGEVMRDQIEALGGTVVGEAFRPLNTGDFSEAVQQIRAAKPDVILNTINGDANLAFFRALKVAGITSHSIPTISFSIAEPEIRRLDLDEMAGGYAAWNYFMAIDRPENLAFIKQFRAKFGPTRVTCDPTASAYVGVHLWAKAVSKAGSSTPSSVRPQLAGLRYDAPGGFVHVDPLNGHLWKIARIARLDDEGQFQVVSSSGSPVKPVPFPPSRTKKEWQALLQSLYDGWGGHWSAPST